MQNRDIFTFYQTLPIYQKPQGNPCVIQDLVHHTFFEAQWLISPLVTILQHYNEDLDRSLKLLSNLTNQHLYLNCYSKVTVKFVVPVFSEITAKIPKISGTTEISEMAKYYQILDHFFDCLNVRSLENHQTKTRPFLKPYINENDKRFSWMTKRVKISKKWVRGQLIFGGHFLILSYHCNWHCFCILV